MNILDKLPILRVLEELGASPDFESWWTEAVAHGLEEMADEGDRIISSVEPSQSGP